MNDTYTCAEDEFCEEVDCGAKCWLPAWCRCETEGKFKGRMMCADDCFKHPGTQWGLCVPISDADVEPAEGQEDEDEPAKTHFHFYTPSELLYNAKLHIDEDSPMRRTPDPVESHDEL